MCPVTGKRGEHLEPYLGYTGKEGVLAVSLSPTHKRVRGFLKLQVKFNIVNIKYRKYLMNTRISKEVKRAGGG